MLFIHNQDVDYDQRPQLIINGKPINNKLSSYYLGLTVDHQLNWSEHITNMCSTINSKLYYLRNLSKFLSHAGYIVSNLPKLYSAIF